MLILLSPSTILSLELNFGIKNLSGEGESSVNLWLKARRG